MRERRTQDNSRRLGHAPKSHCTNSGGEVLCAQKIDAVFQTHETCDAGESTHGEDAADLEFFGVGQVEFPDAVEGEDQHYDVDGGVPCGGEGEVCVVVDASTGCDGWIPDPAAGVAGEEDDGDF